MASTLKKLTGMGGDVRKIAALLQKKAPPGHKLAYINDEEAALAQSPWWLWQASCRHWHPVL